jgi:hypothetical protein
MSSEMTQQVRRMIDAAAQLCQQPLTANSRVGACGD